MHSLKLSRTHVDWHSVDEAYLYSDATTSKIARTVTQKLGFSKGEWSPVYQWVTRCPICLNEENIPRICQKVIDQVTSL